MKQAMIFSGNLASDAEVVECKNGAKFIRFSVAVDERVVKDENGQPVLENGYPKTEPEWYRCQIYVAAGKQTKVAEHLKKGTFVTVSAYPQAEGWLDKNHDIQARISWNVQRIDF